MNEASENLAADAFVQRVTAAMRDGSEDAYTEFYQAYFDRLYRHLLVLAQGSEPLARDLVQAVLLRIVRYIQPFQVERAFWAWLKQLARSCHIDHLRRAGRTVEHFATVLPDEHQLPAAPAPEDDSELFAALDRSLGQLESDDLRLIQHIYIERQPQDTIAAETGTTRKAVESRLARIRKKLKASILDYLKDYALS